VYIANHVSWFDIFALATVVPSYTFVAKMELRRIPLFGIAAEATGIVFIDRENRKTAFDAYKGAREVLVKGRNIVVCPEGTRGYSYALRPFKKGPFVLAISAQAAVVPVFVYGAREVMPKGSFRIRPGTIHLHFLPAIETAGLTYDDRADLVARAWHRIDDTFRREYPAVAAAEPATTKETLA
jgi:1-acyl-sn-glycerol-3-phosphate acyltransferase